MPDDEEEFGFGKESEGGDGVYSEEGREELTEEEDELPGSDEGVMQGFEKGDEEVFCANCKKILKEDEIVEEINGKLYKFCSVECANEFDRKRSEQEEEEE